MNSRNEKKLVVLCFILGCIMSLVSIFCAIMALPLITSYVDISKLEWIPTDVPPTVDEQDKTYLTYIVPYSQPITRKYSLRGISSINGEWRGQYPYLAFTVEELTQATTMSQPGLPLYFQRTNDDSLATILSVSAGNEKEDWGHLIPVQHIYENSSTWMEATFTVEKSYNEKWIHATAGMTTFYPMILAGNKFTDEGMCFEKNISLYVVSPEKYKSIERFQAYKANEDDMYMYISAFCFFSIFGGLTLFYGLRALRETRGRIKRF